MLLVPTDLARRYESVLESNRVALRYRSFYHKWLRYYLDFCHKYQFDHLDSKSFPHFNGKLREKNQSEPLRKQADHAVSLYYEMSSTIKSREAREPVVRRNMTGRDFQDKRPIDAHRIEDTVLNIPSDIPPSGDRASCQLPVSNTFQNPLINDEASESRAQYCRANRRHENASGLQVSAQQNARVAGVQQTAASWQWVFDKLESSIKVRHYSPKTLKAYRTWTQKLQTFVKSKDPSLVAMDDVRDFLSFLAVEKKVSASSQNQAFNALLFLFKHVLEKDFERIEGVVRAKKKPYIPVVLSREEVDRVLSHLSNPYDLVGKLLYGCGLRLSECLKLRVQDLNFDMRVVTVHDGKGKKDRTVPLPEVLIPELNIQLEIVLRIHREDLAAGYAGVFLPSLLAEKYKSAAKEVPWQWFFPARTLTLVPDNLEYRRYHLHDRHVQKAIKNAVRTAQIPKRASAHTFRHSFASHLLQANYDIRTTCLSG